MESGARSKLNDFTPCVVQVLFHTGVWGGCGEHYDPVFLVIFILYFLQRGEAELLEDSC